MRGIAETANQALRCVRKGRTVIVVGVFGHRPSIDLGLVQDRRLEVRGTLMYQRQDYVEAIRCLAEGGITFVPLLASSRRFEDWAEDGAIPLKVRLRERAVEILKTHRTVLLPGQTLKVLRGIADELRAGSNLHVSPLV